MDDVEQTKCRKCRPITQICAQRRHLGHATDAESVIDDALLQAMPHIKHTLIILWHCEILSGILTATFLIKYYSFLGSGLDLGSCDINIHPFNRDVLSVKALSYLLQVFIIVCHSKRNEKGSRGSPRSTY